MAAEAKLVITAEANTQKAQQELNKLKGAGITTADEIAKANRRAARHPLRILAPWALVIGGIMKGAKALVRQFGELVKRGKQLEETAKNLSLSVETYSALEAHAKRAGVTTEQFNAAMARLKDGKATLDEISRGFGDIADKAKAAGDIGHDVFARQAKSWADAWETVWNATKKFWVRTTSITKESKLGFLGFPAIDAAIEQGLDRGEAIKLASKEMGAGVDGRVRDLGRYYDSRMRAREGEQLRSEMRLAASYMKDIGDEGRAREAWQKYTGKTVTEERFRAFVEQGKDKSDKYSDILAKYKDAPKEQVERAEKVEKGAMFEGAFTYGGGALDGLTYAFLADCQGSYEYEQVKALREIKKQNDKGVQTLGEISKTLKGE